MVEFQGSAAVAAKLASGGPGGHGGGALSVLGLGGWALEWKHGWAAIIEPFAGCGSIAEVLSRLVALNDATFLGLGFFAAILIVSTASLVLGVYRLLRGFLPPQGKTTPPGEAEEKDL